MFGRLFLGELKKIIRVRGLVAVLVICAVFFIVFALIYNINIGDMMEEVEGILDVEGEVLEDEFPDDFEMTDEEYVETYGYINEDFIHLANADNIDVIIESVKKSREERVKMEKEDPDNFELMMGYDLYYIDSALSVLNYMKINNIYGEDINVEGYADYYTIKTAESFAETYFELVLGILAIYGIVLGAGLYAEEYATGTIKLTMLRPIGRNQLTLAKLSAMYAYLLTILGSTTLISFLYGWIAFGSVATAKVIVPFNAVTAFSSTAGAMVLNRMFFGVLSLLAVTTLSFAIGTVTRRKSLGIILTFVVDLGIIAGIFSAFGGDRFLYSTNMDLSVYFGMNGPSMEKANVYIAIPMFVIYTAITVVTTFITVKKRDIV